jgi:uncharacterized SAM-binding protein YcdF (DUF218 family)
MYTSWLVTNLIAAFLLPPLNLLLLGVAGFLLLKRRRALGRGLLAVSLAGIWLLSTPYVADHLLHSVSVPPSIPSGNEAEAIVILGGGSIPDAIEYGGDTMNSYTTARVRYGARLARKTGKPVLVTGGAVSSTRSEAEIMREALEGEYGIPVRWVEAASTNTWENARLSAEILHKDGIRRIYLVSHAWHLKRAMPQFEQAGLTVVPAGTGFPDPDRIRPLDLLPSAKGLLGSYLAMHEGIGLIWYRIRNLF